MRIKNIFPYLIIILLVAYIGYTDFYNSSEQNFVSEKFNELTAQSSTDLYANSETTINQIIDDFSIILDNQDYYINKTVTLKGQAENFAQYIYIYDSNGEMIKIEPKRSRKLDKEKIIKIEGIILPTYNSMPEIVKDENGKNTLQYKRDGIYLEETSILKN